MKSFSANTHIDAPPDAVWSVLVDGAAWPDWEPNTVRIDGRIGDGEKITIHTKLSDRAFPVKVTTFEPASRMVFEGGMALGLFKGVRTYVLVADDGGTRFEMDEVFSGLMSPLIERSIPDLQPAFDAFAAALKSRAEGAAS